MIGAVGTLGLPVGTGDTGEVSEVSPVRLWEGAWVKCRCRDAPTHTHTHAHTRTHARTHAHTHARTHTLTRRTPTSHCHKGQGKQLQQETLGSKHFGFPVLAKRTIPIGRGAVQNIPPSSYPRRPPLLIGDWHTQHHGDDYHTPERLDCNARGWVCCVGTYGCAVAIAAKSQIICPLDLYTFGGVANRRQTAVPFDGNGASCASWNLP